MKRTLLQKKKKEKKDEENPPPEEEKKDEENPPPEEEKKDEDNPLEEKKEEEKNNENPPQQMNQINDSKEKPDLLQDWSNHLKSLRNKVKKVKLNPEQEHELILCIRFSFLSHKDLMMYTNDPIIGEYKELILQGLSIRLNTYETTPENNLLICIKPRKYLNEKINNNNNNNNRYQDGLYNQNKNTQDFQYSNYNNEYDNRNNDVPYSSYQDNFDKTFIIIIKEIKMFLTVV